MAKPHCDEKTNEYIKDIIYNNKIVIFGFTDCSDTQNLSKFFKNEYNHDSKIIYVDQIGKGNTKDNSNNNTKINKESFKDCILLRTKDLILPKTFANGMYLGGYKKVQEINYRRDLDILF